MRPRGKSGGVGGATGTGGAWSAGGGASVEGEAVGATIVAGFEAESGGLVDCAAHGTAITATASAAAASCNGRWVILILSLDPRSRARIESGSGRRGATGGPRRRHPRVTSEA